LSKEVDNMESSQSRVVNSQQVPNDVREAANIYEDEIDMIDYIRVFWKRKWFILLGSVIPGLIVGLISFFQPRDYIITYTYDVKDYTYDVEDQFGDQTITNVSNWNLDEKNYKVLLNRFYSEGNLSRIRTRLQREGLNEYAEQISKARGVKDLEELVKFEALPPYIDLSKVKETDPIRLEQIRQLKALLLNVTIKGSPRKDISKIASVIGDNIENTIPVYSVAEQLNLSIREFKGKMARIEKDRFASQLALKKGNAMLAKLKHIKTETLAKTESDITLQFDVGSRFEYLPIEYQIQTAESRIIQLEETVKDNEEKYKYYKDLLSLNKELLAEAKNKSSSAYMIQQFHSFLIELVKGIEKEQLKDYLNSYVKAVENRIAAGVPITEYPVIYAVSKGIVKKTAIVFAIALMLSVFGAFLLEGLKKSQAQAS